MTKKGHLSAFFLHTEENPAQTRCPPLALILLATLITTTSQAQTVDPPPAQNPGQTRPRQRIKAVS